MSNLRAVITAGLGYGNDGIGTTVDYLVRKFNSGVVIKYSGGPQVGHRVEDNRGKSHVFSQFGSGTFVKGVRTHLTRDVLVEPQRMLNEFDRLNELGLGCAFDRLSIDEMSPVITPFHIAANRIQEVVSGTRRVGSCGFGIGETMEDVVELGSDALRIRDSLDTNRLRNKLIDIRARKRKKVEGLLSFLPDSVEMRQSKRALTDDAALDQFIRRFQIIDKLGVIVDSDYIYSLLREGDVIFEGSAGMLIDPNYGFLPYITKTDVSFSSALRLLSDMAYNGKIIKLGVTRGYCTRHGEGPFVTEDGVLTLVLPDLNNTDNEWQGILRVGYFDAVAIRYAITAIGGVDEIVVTNLDRILQTGNLRACNEYVASYFDAENFRNQFFELNGNGNISELVYDQNHNYSDRVHLSVLLGLLRPEYTHLYSSEDDPAMEYIEFLESFIGQNITIASFGPTAQDKLEF